MQNRCSKTQHPSNISKQSLVGTLHWKAYICLKRAFVFICCLCHFYATSKVDSIECAILCFLGAVLVRSLRGGRPTQGCTGCHIRKLFVTGAGAGQDWPAKECRKTDVKLRRMIKNGLLLPMKLIYGLKLSTPGEKIQKQLTFLIIVLARSSRTEIVSICPTATARDEEAQEASSC